MDDNGLLKSWINYSTFINPPYSQIKRWIQKSIDEMDNRFETYGKTGQKPSPIVLLVPARTDTKYFHKIASHPMCNIVFIKGRLQFDKNKTSKAPFPSCIIILSLYSSTMHLGKQGAKPIVTWTLDLKP